MAFIWLVAWLQIKAIWITQEWISNSLVPKHALLLLAPSTPLNIFRILGILFGTQYSFSDKNIGWAVATLPHWNGLICTRNTFFMRAAQLIATLGLYQHLVDELCLMIAVVPGLTRAQAVNNVMVEDMGCQQSSLDNADHLIHLEPRWWYAQLAKWEPQVLT